MLHELAALGSGNSPIDAFTKPGFVLQEPQGGIFHEFFSAGAAVTGDLRKLRFLLGGKVYFRGPKIRGIAVRVNRGGLRRTTPLKQVYYGTVRTIEPRFFVFGAGATRTMRE